MRQRAKGDATLRPDANLELDLGLDSMERGSAVNVGAGMRPYDLVPVP